MSGLVRMLNTLFVFAPSGRAQVYIVSIGLAFLVFPKIGLI
jgi:hypothetical protein